jgi:hypothetical protein
VKLSFIGGGNGVLGENHEPLVRHYIAEIVLKVVLNTITLTPLLKKDNYTHVCKLS